MTVQSYSALFGLVGIVYDRPDPATRQVLYVLRDEIMAYTHEISAIGGFLSASLTIAVPNQKINEWLESGLNRYIVMTAMAGEIVWEGVVNELETSYGGLTLKRGPLLDITNRVLVEYTPIFDAEEEEGIVTGDPTETVIAEDADSQDKYGIIERVISGGQLLDDGTTNLAEILRDTFLASNKWPLTSVDITTAKATTNQVNVLSINMVGLFDYLRLYIYNDDTDSTIQASTKITDVLAADPNGYFSTNPQIDFNGILTVSLEEKNRTAGDIIDEVVSLGDINGNRWIFGIYEDGVPYYNAIPTEPIYRFRIYSDTIQVYDMLDNLVKPWMVRPGQWIYIPDILIGLNIPTSDFQKDPRYQFIERVRYEMPDTVTIESTRLNSYEAISNQIAGGLFT